MIVNQTVLMAALEWAYDKAMKGGGPFPPATQLAHDQLVKTGSKLEASEKIINRQIASCATSGFVTGLGGLMTMPLTIPANISSVLLLQLRMILAIAVLGGYDPRSEVTKALAFACLTGSSARTILEEAGVKTGERLTQRVMTNIGEHVLNKIQYLVKIRLLTKGGRIGLVKLSKVIPIVGGLVGGTIDAASTKMIGKAAQQMFLTPQLN